ncbi:MAG TPA: UDP-N-acetylmuramoyl-tripeptide--D-alanyl-D-alanine ligase [Steroidobacteraceae bacterium]|nr:UDP-N-acetylmuramoyl-tripeptide--D-alanyl-D-alanine ligase [Steroidobacteraceae bacterium]
MKRTLAAVAAACGGFLQGQDREYGAVSSDSRTLQSGALFVAIKGPRFDGHDFLHACLRNGAAGAIVSQPLAILLPQVVVKDTLVALAALASAWRSQFEIPLVGVAGSNGKTTVKEMTASILARLGPCLATLGNLNNHIGVPLTLMRLDATHRTAVIEMGANRVGDVAALAAIAQPTVGLITNAGAEHLEGFGSLDGVAQGEGEMVAALGPNDTAVINLDDDYAPLWRRLSKAGRTVTFGLAREAEVRAVEVEQSVTTEGFALRFELVAGAERCAIQLRLAGRHNVINALAAAAAARAAGASLEAIAAGLAAVRAVKGRLQRIAAPNGSWLIDDSYNANPSSLRAALELLHDLDGPKWLVLADMGELGEFSQQSHVEAGALARASGVARLFAAGPMSAHAAEAFGRGAEWFPDVETLIRRVAAELEPGTTVLIKGSRMNRLERVVEALAAPTAKAS